MIFFSLYFSTRIPAGIETMPYAIKKAKGRTATNVRLNLKPLMISGTNGPMILVRNEITKKVNRIRATT
jgi:hypothetical protein